MEKAAKIVWSCRGMSSGVNKYETIYKKKIDSWLSAGAKLAYTF